MSTADAAGDRVGEAHARLLNDPSLQFTFSEAPKTVQQPTPDWVKAVLDLLEAAGPVMKYVFWGGLAVAALLIAWFIVREMLAIHWRRPRATKGSETPGQWRPAPEQARVLLEDADGLAAAGRYAEAAHLLLLRTIGDIEGRRPDLVRPALTTRDIGALAALPESARPAFGFIAQIVERSLFGGRPVDAAAFAQARRAYADFALPAEFSRGRG